MKSEKARSNATPLTTKETAGWLFASNENDHVSFGAANEVIGVDDENVPLAL